MGHSTKAHPKAVKAVALALFTAGKSSTEVAEITGLKPGCIKSWIKRESWTAARSQARELTIETTRRVVAAEIDRLGRQTRQTLAQGVHKLAEVVTDEHATPSKLATAETKSRIVGNLVGSAKVLHDWGNGTDERPLVLVGLVEQAMDREDSADTVDATVVDTVQEPA
ncbi:MAG: hypothetical protein ABSC03_06805 [Verrucomicrobiota bacterium]|jgi:hypothetical protein